MLRKITLATTLLIGAATVVAAAYAFIIRPWHLRWGATDAEVQSSLPGDELIPAANSGYTRALTIKAPAEAVWPWLVQMGQDRGGLYSYDWLENLVGCNIHSAERIVPEWQNLKVGDRIPLYPDPGPGYTVMAIQPVKALILQARDPGTGKLADASWQFILQRVDEHTTRLLLRSRSVYTPSVSNFIMWQVIVDPLDFIMGRKMLYGIKARAEMTWGQSPASSNR